MSKLSMPQLNHMFYYKSKSRLHSIKKTQLYYMLAPIGQIFTLNWVRIKIKIFLKNEIKYWAQKYIKRN